MIATLTAFAGVQAPAEADAMLAQLSKIRLDKKHIYSVRDITLTRDALSISLNRGALAFTEAVDGRVTGAVFLGNGDILAIPPNAIEKQQLFRYTKSALLNEHFEIAVFRFTDGTFDEILRQYRTHAEEPVDADTTNSLLRWESEMQRRSAYLNHRLLEDILPGSSRQPFFLAQIEATQLGWFDVIYDERRTEEVFVQQSTTLSAQPLVWASFNKRSEVRDPAAFAHEDKSMIDLLSVSADGTSLRLKIKADGERVLDLPASAARITEIDLDGKPLLFLQNGDHLAAVLPEPTRSGNEITLRIAYAAEDTAARVRSIVRANGVSPATYRDQWIIEGLGGYAAAASDLQWLSQARSQLLEQSPEGGTYESRGPVSIGFRMMQPHSTPGYAAALRNKSAWIMHMLRNVMQGRGDAAFADFVEELRSQSHSKPLSTYDFKAVAERHDGKPLDWFFDDWVFGTGIPAYKLEYKVDAGSGGFVVSGSISQSGVPDTFEMPVPVYADDVLLGMVNVSVDGGDFRFTLRSRPQQVRLDPKRTILTQLPLE